MSNGPTIILLKNEIDSLKKENDRLRDEVTKYRYDSLTGLKTRIDYNETLDNTESDINNDGGIYTFVLIDMVDLHNINIDHGYDYGDKVIGKLAYILASLFNHGDVYRIGGDEFVVVINGKAPLNTIKELDNTPVDITHCYITINGKTNESLIDIRSVMKKLDSCLIKKKGGLKRRNNDR